VFVRIKKAPLIPEVIRVIKTLRHRHAVDVPFPRVVGAIARRLEPFGQKSRPGRSRVFLAAAAAHSRNRVTADLLRVVAGEQGGARRPAAGGVVELGVTQSVRGERVEVRRRNLRTVAAEIGEAEVVREDEKDVRLRRVGGEDGEREGEEKGNYGLHAG